LTSTTRGRGEIRLVRVLWKVRITKDWVKIDSKEGKRIEELASSPGRRAPLVDINEDLDGERRGKGG